MDFLLFCFTNNNNKIKEEEEEGIFGNQKEKMNGNFNEQKKEKENEEIEILFRWLTETTFLSTLLEKLVLLLSVIYYLLFICRCFIT